MENDNLLVKLNGMNEGKILCCTIMAGVFQGDVNLLDNQLIMALVSA